MSAAPLCPADEDCFRTDEGTAFVVSEITVSAGLETMGKLVDYSLPLPPATFAPRLPCVGARFSSDEVAAPCIDNR